jgi:hypothetical protein
MTSISSARRLCARAAILACALAAAGLATPASAQGQAFSFGLWGDMPYAKANDAPKIPALIASINASDIAFSLYDGDIKDGSSKCTDNVFAEALDMFGAMVKPVHYIPGDNEWTDCHRLNNGGYDNLERLAYTRKVMFPGMESLGKTKMPVERQGKLGEKFVENMRFSHGGIVFVGLNVPGSNNNRVLDEKDCSGKSARTPAQCDADNAEYAERDAANIAWMKEAFALARANKAPGIVLVWQGDPGFDLPETEELDESASPKVNGYRAFMDQIVKETEAFPGQVMVVHGDTHFFKVDKPLYSPTKLLPNLTRVQTFGSPAIHWVRVTVDPASEQVFTIHPMIVKGN